MVPVTVALTSGPGQTAWTDSNIFLKFQGQTPYIPFNMNSSGFLCCGGKAVMWEYFSSNPFLNDSLCSLLRHLFSAQLTHEMLLTIAASDCS